MRPTHASSPHAPSLAQQDAPLFAVSLNAVIVAATPEEPRILVLRTEHGRLEALPAGPLTPYHRTLEAGLRAWVEQQTDQHLGYVEQLYTFGDRSRTETDGAVAPGTRDRLLGPRARSAASRLHASGVAELVSLLPLGGLA